MIEAIAKTAHLAVQFVFARVGKRRMTDVVAQGQRLGEFFIEMERRSHGAGDLGHFNGVGEPVPKMIRDAGRKDLSFIFKASKSPRMDDAVAIALELTAVRMRQFGISPAPASLDWKTEAA
jgi:hypothetical protein